jgi:CRP/FNR family transcriptional regulator, anaerobic regulatory protein
LVTPNGPWPCPFCPAKGSSFCRAIAPTDALAARLRHAQIRRTQHAAEAGRVVYRPGKSSDDVHILCEGWAFTYRRLPNGRRQILTLLLPGDIFASRMIFAAEDYISVASITDIHFSRIHAPDLRREIVKNPDLVRNLARFVAAETQRYIEAMVDLGQRNAEARIAHFLTQLTGRLDAACAHDDGRYPFPLRQIEIADTVGLTPVHVSRVMSKFRREALIDVGLGELVIKDRGELTRRAADG